jgi:hypothetical protein
VIVVHRIPSRGLGVRGACRGSATSRARRAWAVGVRLARTSRAELARARACPYASLAARPRQPASATSPTVVPEIAGGSHRARPASCARGSCGAGYARLQRRACAYARAAGRRRGAGASRAAHARACAERRHLAGRGGRRARAQEAHRAGSSATASRAGARSPRPRSCSRPRPPAWTAVPAAARPSRSRRRSTSGSRAQR